MESGVAQGVGDNCQQVYDAFGADDQGPAYQAGLGNQLDDRIYYTQGVILVIRDFLQSFVHLYPEVKEKGGEENIRIAFRDMDLICDFDPLIVLRGTHDSIMANHRGKMARYLISVRERINDVAQSIRR